MRDGIYQRKRPAAILAKRPFTSRAKTGTRSYNGDDIQAIKLQQARRLPASAPERGGIFKRARGLEAKTILRTPGAPSRIAVRPEGRKRRAGIEIKVG